MRAGRYTARAGWAVADGRRLLCCWLYGWPGFQWYEHVLAAQMLRLGQLYRDAP